jgi:hypothetical protein
MSARAGRPQVLNKVLQRWMLSHLALQEPLESLLCDRKTLRGRREPVRTPARPLWQW